MSGLLNFLIIDWVWTTPVTRGRKVATLAPWAKSVSLVTRQCLEDSSSHGVTGQKHRQEGGSRESPQHSLSHMTTSSALWPLAGPLSKKATSSSKYRYRHSQLARWLARMIQNKQGCTVGCAAQLNIRDRRTQLLSEESPHDSPSPSFPALRGHLLSTAIRYSEADIYREKENL